MCDATRTVFRPSHSGAHLLLLRAAQRISAAALMKEATRRPHVLQLDLIPRINASCRLSPNQLHLF